MFMTLSFSMCDQNMISKYAEINVRVMLINGNFHNQYTLFAQYIGIGYKWLYTYMCFVHNCEDWMEIVHKSIYIVVRGNMLL